MNDRRALYNVVFCMKGCLIFLLVLIATVGQAQTKIWNEVVTGYANTPIIKVTKVALYDDRTEVNMHVDYIKGQWISLAPNTVIKVDDSEYSVKDVTVLTLGEQYIMPEDTLNFVLKFEPVPTDIKAFDFVEPNGWCIKNIHSTEYFPKGILDTY